MQLEPAPRVTPQAVLGAAYPVQVDPSHPSRTVVPSLDAFVVEAAWHDRGVLDGSAACYSNVFANEEVDPVGDLAGRGRCRSDPNGRRWLDSVPPGWCSRFRHRLRARATEQGSTPALPATPDTGKRAMIVSVRDRNRSDEANERAISFPTRAPGSDREAVLVRIERWETAGRRRNRGGLVLYIHGFGIQAHRSRSIDDARAMVIDSLRSHDVDVPDEVTITWTDNSR